MSQINITLNIIYTGGLVAIGRLADLSAAVPISQALLNGGITALNLP